MKLVLVFLLAAIPICCYASSEFCGGVGSGFCGGVGSEFCEGLGGSNCHAMDDVVAQITNSSVSVAEFQKVIKSYAPLPYDQKSLGEVKQCFLDQSEETLANYRVMMDVIYDSEDCPQTS
ncbi:secretoglobin family 2A member 2-like [Microtus oregoni]|uniref:secretoglobin family 2A member 2-like n=1 Tax=Microtus oregoni TaxID=111838 RepID=UPI001BB1C9B3|nr:secretoglobin family 2A member 2-like [Microtus oregoni]